MKCLYYLISGLDSAHAISNDLRDAGIADWSIHVQSKNDADLNILKIYSDHYHNQLEMPRVGILGVLAGFLFGLLTAALLDSFQLFGAKLPLNAYIGLTLFWSLFGAWEGGFVGIVAKKRNTNLLHDKLAAGGYLLLIYAESTDDAAIQAVMLDKHPEAELAASHPNFNNPLTDLSGA